MPPSIQIHHPLIDEHLLLCRQVNCFNALDYFYRRSPPNDQVFNHYIDTSYAPSTAGRAAVDTERSRRKNYQEGIQDP